MSARAESASLVLQLFHLRQEPAMREASRWFVTDFDPKDAGAIVDLVQSSMGDSARYRMVTGYWEMACSFITHGAVDAAMFQDSNTEHLDVYVALEPFLADVRVRLEWPDYLIHLEKIALGSSRADHEIEKRRQRLGPPVRASDAARESA